MKFIISLAFFVATFAITSTGQLYAQDAEAPRDTDEQMVRKSIEAFTRAFESGNAEAAAQLLTSGAELIAEDGAVVRSREAIQNAIARHNVEHPNVKIEKLSDAIRFPSRDTAVVDGRIRVVHPDSGTANRRFEIQCAREDGKWLLAKIEEWPHERAALLDLEWIIGTWKSKQGSAEVETTYEWFGDQAFIRAHFTIRENEQSVTGMQMIGVDPETGLLRTWIFEANGGVGEGVALQDGKQWVFESTTELTSGDVLEATNILVRIDGNSFTWQPLDLSINGEQFGNLPPSKVTRVR
ncbi:YybH family protein [Aporhodopirellula aestuarii]|uniref:Nuclear transport factor 2 family protein n=1 Tax=Aporhodopirellula aestuarii TaxID=2950107 RepID=A0ABT0TXW9_9BACT|nr:nuclear transport factor 2 family protein [Aporhodopirellula aestuarii]MCM2369453.1 nuclear transport factor 2 family protein [Aporhodopirellula aestuarii]